MTNSMNDSVILSFDKKIWSLIDKKRNRDSRTDFLQRFVVSILRNPTRPSCTLEKWFEVDRSNLC